MIIIKDDAIFYNEDITYFGLEHITPLECVIYGYKRNEDALPCHLYQGTPEQAKRIFEMIKLAIMDKKEIIDFSGIGE